MLIPIAAETGDRRPATVTTFLVVLTVGVSLLLMSPLDAALGWGQFGPQANATLSRVARALALERAHPTPWSLVGHALLHAGWLHLVGNMIVLLVLGNALEPRLGSWRYLALYLGGAVVGGLAFLAGGDGRVAVGASGAIMAVAGGFLLFLPTQRVAVLVPLQLLLGLLLVRLFGLTGLVVLPVCYLGLALYGAADAEEGLLLRLAGFRALGLPGWLLVGGAVGLDLWATLTGARDGVGHLSHLAGAALGIALGTLLLLTRSVVAPERTLLHMLGWRGPLRPFAPRALPGRAAAAWLAARRHTERPRPAQLSFSDWARRREQPAA